MSAPQPQRPKFQLKINTGHQDAPERILIYGTPGIGKSTLAAQAPNPVFLDLEGGSSNLNIARVEGLRTWEDLLAATHALATEPHNFETLVIDTLDRAEWLCWQHVCKKAGVDSIEKVGKGFGKGYIAAYEEFRRLFAAVESAWRDRRLHIVFLAHAKLETVKNPAGPDYQRYTLKVHDKVAGLFYEASDAALFAHYEVFYNTDETRAKAIGGERRLLHTVELPGHIAKNRYGLSERIPLDWEALVLGAAQGGRPELLRATIRDLGRQLGDDASRRIQTSITRAGADTAALTTLFNRVREAFNAAPAATPNPSTPSAAAPSVSTDATSPSPAPAPAEVTTTTTTNTTTENAQ